MKNLHVFMASFAASFSLFGAADKADASDLLVSPVRVVFEGRDRVAEVTLVNKGQSTANYRVGFENRRMDENGSLKKIEEAGEGDLFAENYVRYAPRRVSLQPNVPQTLRLMLRKPADMAAGEYRSHLHFAAVPDDAGGASIERRGGSADGLSIQLTPIYGVTIPVIIRHGDVSAAAQVENVDFRRNADGGGTLSVRLQRNGNISLYGDIDVYLQGEDSPAVQKRGIALYTPNVARLIDIALTPEQYSSLAGRNVEIRYRDRTKSGAGVEANAIAILN